jgi:hypothetical protein
MKESMLLALKKKPKTTADPENLNPEFLFTMLFQENRIHFRAGVPEEDIMSKEAILVSQGGQRQDVHKESDAADTHFQCALPNPSCSPFWKKKIQGKEKTNYPTSWPKP